MSDEQAKQKRINEVAELLEGTVSRDDIVDIFDCFWQIDSFPSWVLEKQASLVLFLLTPEGLLFLMGIKNALEGQDE